MRSFLVITVPAVDLALLNAAELRSAAGVVDNSFDAQLAAVGLSVARAISTECNVASGSGGAPTLKRERLTETFFQICTVDLVLARRHEVSISSIKENGTLLAETDYAVDVETGLVTRLGPCGPTRWRAQVLEVVYDAGFLQVPDDLKRVASDFVRGIWRESQRDPLLKSERISTPGVDEVERSYWVGPVPGQATLAAVPQALSGGLMRYRNEGIA